MSTEVISARQRRPSRPAAFRTGDHRWIAGRLDLDATLRLNGAMAPKTQYEIDIELWRGTIAGDPIRVRKALDEGGDPNNHIGSKSLLTLAALAGSRECVAMLLPIPDPSHREQRCGGPSWWARSCDQPAIADFIEGWFESQREWGELSDATSASAANRSFRGRL